MATTGLTRQEIKQIVTDFYGSPPRDTYARFPEEADQRLAHLYEAVRDQQRMVGGAPIDTAEKAGKLRRLIQKHSPAEVRDSWDDPDTVQILPDGSIEIDNSHPEARILDLGGTIRKTDSTGREYTARVPALHYVAKAISEYNASEGQQNPLIDEVNMSPPGPKRLSALLQLGLETLKGKRRRQGDRPPGEPPPSS